VATLTSLRPRIKKGIRVLIGVCAVQFVKVEARLRVWPRCARAPGESCRALPCLSSAPSGRATRAVWRAIKVGFTFHGKYTAREQGKENSLSRLLMSNSPFEKAWLPYMKGLGNANAPGAPQIDPADLIRSKMKKNNQLEIAWSAFERAGEPQRFPTDLSLNRILVRTGLSATAADQAIAKFRLQHPAVSAVAEVSSLEPSVDVLLRSRTSTPSPAYQGNTHRSSAPKREPSDLPTGDRPAKKRRGTPPLAGDATAEGSVDPVTLVQPNLLQESRQKYGEPRGYLVLQGDPPAAIPQYFMEDFGEEIWDW